MIVLNLENKFKEKVFFFVFTDNLNEFGLSGQHYRSPRLVLLGLIKRVQEEKYLREKRARIPNDSSSQDISLEQFNYAKGIGQFAVNVYYASWYWKMIIKISITLLDLIKFSITLADLIKFRITLLDLVLDRSKNISGSLLVKCNLCNSERWLTEDFYIKVWSVKSFKCVLPILFNPFIIISIFRLT